ncbi:MAG: NADPH-dependent FMN reductase [Burkholderiales bacterium]|jgi:FMN reductase
MSRSNADASSHLRDVPSAIPSTLFVAGSPSASSRSSAIAAHLRARLVHSGWRADTLSLRDLPAQALLHADPTEPRIAAALDRVDDAAALVIVTPVYKASFSGLLKTFVDLLPQHALAGKTVLPVATGGSLAHALVLDYALRPVLAAAGATHVLPGVFVADAQLQGDPLSGLRIAPELESRFDASVDALVASLVQASIRERGRRFVDADTELARRACSG